MRAVKVKWSCLRCGPSKIEPVRTKIARIRARVDHVLDGPHQSVLRDVAIVYLDTVRNRSTQWSIMKLCAPGRWKMPDHFGMPLDPLLPLSYQSMFAPHPFFICNLILLGLGADDFSGPAEVPEPAG